MNKGFFDNLSVFIASVALSSTSIYSGQNSAAKSHLNFLKSSRNLTGTKETHN